jgi:hypothetical protein
VDSRRLQQCYRRCKCKCLNFVFSCRQTRQRPTRLSIVPPFLSGRSSPNQSLGSLLVCLSMSA